MRSSLRSKWFALGGSLTAFCALNSTASAQWTVTSLHPGGPLSSRALAVHGQQQVGDRGDGGAAALWFGTAASLVVLGEGAALATDGVQQAGNSGGHGRVWSGSAANYFDLAPPAPYESSPANVTGIDGVEQVGVWAHQTSVYAVHWNSTSASVTSLSGTGSITIPHGIHAGQAVGTSGTNKAFSHGMIWNAGNFQQPVVLHPGSTTYSSALGVHAGCQVGWMRVSGQSQHAAMWFGSTGSHVDLHPPGATTSSANGVHGSIQVGEVDGSAALWTGTASSWVDLGALLAPGFTSSTATGVWADANGATSVSGYATAPDGHHEAMLWTGIVASSTSFCAGDTSGAACPCGNDEHVGSGSGCRNTTGFGGHLAGVGRASIAGDTFALVGNGMPNASVLYFQGTTRTNGGAGSTFGDGLRCASGTIVRLGTTVNVAGGSRYPETGDVPISVRGSNAPGDVRTYQAWYRNAAPFCTPSTFNTTNGVAVTWQS